MKAASMLSTLQPKNFQSAFTAPTSAVHLRASLFGHTVTQHETGTHFRTLRKMEKMNG